MFDAKRRVLHVEEIVENANGSARSTDSKFFNLVNCSMNIYRLVES
jgi:hypothetical protein